MPPRRTPQQQLPKTNPQQNWPTLLSPSSKQKLRLRRSHLPRRSLSRHMPTRRRQKRQPASLPRNCLPPAAFRMGSGTMKPAANPSRPLRGHAETLLQRRGEVTAAEWAACVADGGCTGTRRPAARPACRSRWSLAMHRLCRLAFRQDRPDLAPADRSRMGVRRAPAPRRLLVKRALMRHARATGKNPMELPQNPSASPAHCAMRANGCRIAMSTLHQRPTDGRAVTSGDCSRRVVRGGSIKNSAAEMRSASRARISLTTRDRQIGFRVVLEQG